MKKKLQQVFTNPLSYIIAVIALLPLQIWGCVTLLLDQQRAWADMLTAYIQTSKFEPNFQVGDPRILGATMFVDCALLMVAGYLVWKSGKAQCQGAACPNKKAGA